MLNKKLVPIASFISAGLLPLAHASDQPADNRWYVAPFASFVNTGGDRKASDGWGGGSGCRQDDR
jgi:OOP family OmpA-OmpF porin